MCMTSKNISIKEDVYNELLKIKKDDESFSDLFMRLLKFQRKQLEQSFGSWKITKEEEEEIWSAITKREGRSWTKESISE